MALFQTEKETVASRNSLQCLVQALVGHLISVDLQNDCIVTGEIAEVDGFMNILFHKAQLIDLDNYCYHYDALYVRNRNIRFIHLPKNLNVRETILKFLGKSAHIHYAEKDSKSATTFQRNLHKRQEETRKAVEEMKAAKIKMQQ